MLTYIIKYSNISILGYVLYFLIFMFKRLKKIVYTQIALYVKKLINTVYIISKEY